MAAIQTFPKKFTIQGPRVEIQRQIGNAVPSLMAEILANEIASQLLGRSGHRPLQLAISRRAHIPQPEPTCPVPGKYKHLIGNHKAHPGTGKGPMSQQRKENAQEEANSLEAVQQKLAFG
jgi:DNA (cytosine-5)-methyltransferase 1